MWSPPPKSTLPRVALGKLTFQGPKGGVPGAPKFFLWSQEPQMKCYGALEPRYICPGALEHHIYFRPEPWSPNSLWGPDFSLFFFLSLGGETTQRTSCPPSAGRVTLVGRRTIYHANTLFRSPSRSNS